MDCPPGKTEDASGWIITVFNPSLQVRRIVKFKVNHPHWVVLVWDHNSKNWVPTLAEALCEPVILQTSGKIYDCDVYAVLKTEALEYSYIKLVFDDLVDLTIKESEDREEVVEITNDRISMKYHGSRDGALFTMVKRKGQQMEKFIFDIRYYRSLVMPRSKEQNKNPSSGMYMFVANMTDFGGMSTRYTEVKSFKVYKG